MLINPLFLRTASLFQPVVLDQLWWLLGFWALLRLINTEDPRWWLLLGVAGGLGLLSKFPILFFGLAVLVALVISDRRGSLAGPWPWAALGIALVIGSPSIAGQIRLSFPVVEQMAGLRQGQLNRITLGEQLFEQAIWGPQILLALTGLIALLARRDFRPYRIVGLAALAGFVLFAILKGKAYYAGPLHPPLYAAGAVALERLARPRLQRVLSATLVGAIIAWGVFVLPFGLPVVPPEPMARYAAMTGITAGTKTNWGAQLELPQDYADMLGWKEKAEAVASMLFVQEPSLIRHGAVLYGANYGQAGALDLYGRRLGLPPVLLWSAWREAGTSSARETVPGIPSCCWAWNRKSWKRSAAEGWNWRHGSRTAGACRKNGTCPSRSATTRQSPCSGCGNWRPRDGFIELPRPDPGADAAPQRYPGNQ